MITSISQMCGLTPRAIRFYEQRGLVTPTRDRSNHRQFSAETRERLVLIGRLRSCEIPLSEIEALLAGDSSSTEDLSRRAVERLGTRLRELDQMRVRISQLIDRLLLAEGADDRD